LKGKILIWGGFSPNHPANTGKPIVAVLTNAPAKIRKGSNEYFSIMRS
tara:strand:+ start:130 stop:273 length:144 start_codon:yes stop_codon:yes gene_type:complete